MDRKYPSTAISVLFVDHSIKLSICILNKEKAKWMHFAFVIYVSVMERKIVRSGFHNFVFLSRISSLVFRLSSFLFRLSSFSLVFLLLSFLFRLQTIKNKIQKK